MQDFEKLGAFYLGREYDQAKQSLLENLLLYDSGDLTTNAVCVSMTGSGKTGLCLSLLEEAAIDGIPTLAIDPKGDLGNLYRTRTLNLWKCAAPKLISRPGESEGEFRARVVQASREKRDLAKAILEKKYRPKLERIQERIRRARVRVEREKGQYDQQKLQTAVSLGATVLGALFGRKAASVGTVGRAATTLKGAGRTARERAGIAQVAEQVRVETRRLADLEEEFREELASLESLVDPAGLDLETVRVRPRKADITDSNVTLVWLPWKLGGERTATRAFP